MIRLKHIRSYLTELEARDKAHAFVLIHGERAVAFWYKGSISYARTDQPLPLRVVKQIERWAKGHGVETASLVPPITLSALASGVGIEVI